MSDTDFQPWNDWQNKRLDELRAEIAKPVRNVRAYVQRQRELAQRTTQERVPPSGMAAAREQAEEAETLTRYHAAPEHVRSWLDGHIAARLAGRKAPKTSGWLPLTPTANACRRTCAAAASALIPALWADRVRRDVLLQWKAGELEEEADAEEQVQAADPSHEQTDDEGKRGCA